MTVSVERNSDKEFRCTRPAKLDLSLRQELATWFRTKFLWDCFVTLTFSFVPTSTDANEILGMYLRRIEETVRAPLSCLISEERTRLTAKVARGRIHFHLFVRCARPLDPTYLKGEWEKDCFGGDPDDGASAEVLPYDEAISGTFYILKELEHPGWNWSSWRLDGASKRRPKRCATNCRARRIWRRQQERARCAVQSA